MAYYSSSKLLSGVKFLPGTYDIRETRYPCSWMRFFVVFRELSQRAKQATGMLPLVYEREGCGGGGYPVLRAGRWENRVGALSRLFTMTSIVHKHIEQHLRTTSGTRHSKSVFGPMDRRVRDDFYCCTVHTPQPVRYILCIPDVMYQYTTCTTYLRVLLLPDSI